MAKFGGQFNAKRLDGRRTNFVARVAAEISCLTKLRPGVPTGRADMK